MPGLGGDGYVVAGTDWSSEEHGFTDRVVVYACVYAELGGRVRLTAEGSGIEVSPAVARVDRHGTGIIPFRVRVSPGALGRLWMSSRSGGANSDSGGPEVVVTNSGWRFAAQD